MRIEIPPITRPIYLADYAPQLVDASGKSLVVQVWVNPPRQMLLDHDGFIEQLNQLRAKIAPGDAGALPTGEALQAATTEVQRLTAALMAWCAKIWSQHADPATHWSEADVRALMDSDTDPALYPWLKRRTLAAMFAHRNDVEKK